jgi:pyruvate dehydrogenase E1 component alpha subunit|tara:strand:- start:779 stop:1900 length:1122 start_codon:yes stop_codon:yes gene_type:complete
MKLINHENILKIGKYKKTSLKNINKKLAIKLYTFMLKLRLCEEAIEKEYHPADEMRCPVHFCSGEETVPASLKNILESKDYLYSHHRSHGYYLAKNAPMKKLFAELYGKVSGANSGIAGSQDISYPKNNFFSGAILAGATSIALGTAISFEIKRKINSVVVAGFGDAATDQGIFWESLNYASLKKLPIIFVCENNNYSTFSPQSKRQGGKSIAERAKLFGVKSKTIFGNDICLVYRELHKAVLNARNGKGPFLLETLTYRYSGHVGPLSDEFVGYRSKKEISFWKKNCPIALFEEVLIKKKYLNKNDIKNIKKKINHEISESFDYAKKSDFPVIDLLEDLNLSKKTPIADKILKDLEKTNFDADQKVILPKGY